MDTNHNTFTNVINTTWNNHNNIQTQQQDQRNTITTSLHHQIPISSSIYNWPTNNHHHHYQMPTLPSSPSSSSGMASSSSSLFSDILGGGVHFEEEVEADGEEEELGAMKEMMYKMAAMQPVDIDPATVRKPKRRNVRISDDPQSVAARHRRERISERIRVLQRLVPGGTKMDTASMLEEAVRYVKFLKRQIRLLQSSTTAPHSQSQSHSAVGATGGWPPATAIDMPAGMGFSAISHGHARDIGSSSFDHRKDPSSISQLSTMP